jgi:hypothetical protein
LRRRAPQRAVEHLQDKSVRRITRRRHSGVLSEVRHCFQSNLDTLNSGTCYRYRYDHPEAPESTELGDDLNLTNDRFIERFKVCSRNPVL